MLVKQADKITGKLSQPSKMPGYSYNLPAWECKIGALLRTIKKSVCFMCYAMRGRYVFPCTIKAMERRLKSLPHDLWVKAMAVSINSKAKFGHNCFRWHDSGDLQSMAHLERIIDVCNLTPGVMHWLPTKEFKIMRDYINSWRNVGNFKSWRDIFPANVVPRLSAPMIDGDAPDIDGLPTSTVTSDHKPGKYVCPAPDQGGKCKSCRMCWDANIKSIAYRAH